MDLIRWVMFYGKRCNARRLTMYEWVWFEMERKGKYESRYKRDKKGNGKERK